MMRARSSRRTASPGAAAGVALTAGLVAGVVLGMMLPPVSGAVPVAGPQPPATAARPAGQAAGAPQAGRAAGTQPPPAEAGTEPQAPQGVGAQPPATAAQPAGQGAGGAQPAGQAAGAPQPDQQPVEGEETAEGEGTTEEDRALLEPETFDGPIGLVVNYVDPAGTSDFESVMTRLFRGLAASEDPERVAQAAGWKLFRARETGPDGQAVYVELYDPAVEDADYSVPQLLYETFPAEVQQLYDTWNGSFGAGRIWLNLDPASGDEDESAP